MAFTIKQFNDLRGILYLMLLTIPSIATTNIDCNGKPFHCVNSTHFMICVDLGFGVSSTIDSFIIPCPAPTECRSTNRFECEFAAAITEPTTKEPLGITTDKTTTATVQAIESAQFVPEIITTVSFEDLYNTVSTTTLSRNELSTPNPTFITDYKIINVIDNVNVSTSGGHVDLEVGGSTNVLNITSSTHAVFYETTASAVTIDATVADTTENAIQQTDSNLNTINKLTTTNLSETIVSSVVTDATLANTTENAIQQTDSNTNIINKFTRTNFSETIVSSVVTDATVANTTENVIQQTDSNLNTMNKLTTTSLPETTVSSVVTDAAVANTTDNAIQQRDSNLNIINKLTTTSLPETTVSSVVTDATVANTTENAIQQTDSNLNTINEIIRTNLDIAITTTEYTTLSAFTTTEKVNLIGENKIETKLNTKSENNRVIANVNVTSSIQNQAEYTTESLRSDTHVDKNSVSITEIKRLDQSIIADGQDQLKTDTTKESTVTTTNPLENVQINAANKTTTLTGVPVEHSVTDAVTELTTQIYATTETLAVTSKIIQSDLSKPTESIILVEPNTSIENKVLVDQENQLVSVDKGTIEKTLHSVPKTIIEMPIQDATADYNLSNVAVSTINVSDIITGPSSELHNAIISSTASTVETTIITETRTQDAFYSTKDTGVILTSEVNAATDIGITYDDKYKRVTSISSISIPSSDSNTLTPDAKIVSTESITSEINQNKTVVQSMEKSLTTLSENLLSPVTTEKKLEIISSVTEPVVSDSSINYFESNVDTQSSKVVTASQLPEVSNKPDSDNSVSNLNAQNNILVNIEDNKIQDMKTNIKITTEPTLKFTETDINTNKDDINTKIKLVEHNSITLQPEYETFKIKTVQTTDSSNDFVSETILYLDSHPPEKATKDQVVKSTPADDNQWNSQNNKKNELNTNTGLSILTTKATALYYDATESNKKADQLYTASETNKKLPNFDMDKIISELRKTESRVQETPTTTQNERINTQSQEGLEINTLLNTATETTVYLPLLTGDGKLVSIETTVFEKEPDKMKPTGVDTTSSKNQFSLGTTNIILGVNPMVIDSAVSESYLIFEPNVNVQAPQPLLTETIDIINEHNLSLPEISSQKSNKVEPKGYEIPMTPMTETQTQFRESEFHTQQQKETKSISGITRIAEHDTFSKFPVSESTQNVVDFNVPSGTASPNFILQLTSSPVLENTENSNSASIVLDSIVPTTKNIADNSPVTISELPVPESTRNVVDFNVPSRTDTPDSILQLSTPYLLENTEKSNSAFIVSDAIVPTTKNIVDNSSDFIINKEQNTENYGTGALSKIPTIGVLENLENKVHDHVLQKIASTENQIVIPFTTSLENMQYDTNNKLSKQNSILQTPVKQMTTESKSASQNENPLDKKPNTINTVANNMKNLEPNVLKKVLLNTERVYKPNNQEPTIPILENTLLTPLSQTEKQATVPDAFRVVTDKNVKGIINPEVILVAVLESSNDNNKDLPPSQTEKQAAVPDAFHVVTDKIVKGIINPEVIPVAVLESSNNNNKDLPVTIGITKNGPTLSELPSMGDSSTQNTYIDKEIINKQEEPHTKESIPNVLNNAVHNAGKRTSNVTNHTSTSYSETKNKFNNKISTENSSNLVIFNESNPTAPTPVGKNIDLLNLLNSTVRNNNTNISEAETVQSRSKLESNNNGFVKTMQTQTLDIKIMPIATDKRSTVVTNNFNKREYPVVNPDIVFTATQTSKSPHKVSGDNTVSTVSTAEKNNGTDNTHSSIVFGNKSPQERVKKLAERDVLTTTSNKLTAQVESTNDNSQKVNNNAGEAVNLAPFDLLSSAKSSGFEEKNNKPSTEKPDDEETIGNGNSETNKNGSFTTSSSESVSVTTESVESDNNENIVQSNSKYETLTSKPSIETSTRSTQVDNLKNIQQPIIAEVSTQSAVRSTSQKLSLENNTPLPATTKAITNDFVCKFNQRGRFADKHDCRKFYICHGIPKPLEGICPFYTVFSELRKQCTKNLSHCVRNNQFQCVSEGRFSDFLNDNIYYICARNKLSTFIRFKLRCQNGYRLNKTSVRCVLNTETSQSISSDISKSISEQSAALKMEVKRDDLSKKEFECKKEGTFADPDNCRVYYVCKKTSKSGYLRKKKKCDSDEYFHKDKKKCVDAESYECK